MLQADVSSLREWGDPNSALKGRVTVQKLSEKVNRWYLLWVKSLMLYYWSLVRYQMSYEEKNSGKKIWKPKQTLIDNSMCVKIPMQTESQRGLVKILQLSWEFFCDLNLAAKLLSKTISLAASRPIRRKSIIPIQIKGCCLLIYSVIQLHITNLQWTCVTWLCTVGTRSEADEWNQDKGPSDKDKHVEQGATPKV